MLTGSGRRTNLFTTNTVRDQKGSVLLEFIFSISVLLVIFIFAVTFSFLFADYYGVQKVAREGAREASITGNVDWARIKAEQAAWLWGLDPDRVAVDFFQDRTTVTCQVTYTVSPFHKTFPKLIGGSPLTDVTMNAGATFVWLER